MSHCRPSQKRPIASEDDHPSSDPDRSSSPPKSKRSTKTKVPSPPPGPVYDPGTMRPQKLEDPSKGFQILSWNVAGLRALLKKVSNRVLCASKFGYFFLKCERQQ